ADVHHDATAVATDAAVTGGHQLDPQRVLSLVVRGLTGNAQRGQAVHLLPGVGFTEARDFEDHPVAFVELNGVQLHFSPLRGHLDLGVGADVGADRDADFITGAAQDHRGQV